MPSPTKPGGEHQSRAEVHDDYVLTRASINARVEAHLEALGYPASTLFRSDPGPEFKSIITGPGVFTPSFWSGTCRTCRAHDQLDFSKAFLLRAGERPGCFRRDPREIFNRRITKLICKGAFDHVSFA